MLIFSTFSDSVRKTRNFADTLIPSLENNLRYPWFFSIGHEYMTFSAGNFAELMESCPVAARLSSQDSRPRPPTGHNYNIGTLVNRWKYKHSPGMQPAVAHAGGIHRAAGQQATSTFCSSRIMIHNTNCINALFVVILVVFNNFLFFNDEFSSFSSISSSS
jgi:hypothetical protein